MFSVSNESQTHHSHFRTPSQSVYPHAAPSAPSESAPHDYKMASPPHRPQYPMMPQAHFQPAPRQRTAIACRYCRRRKIRCSGFESSPDARCSNCVRFHQECVFTPVSSQAQAFVPVHAIHSHLRGDQPMGPDGNYPQMVYGAHGQPLGHVTIPSPYPHPPPHEPSYRLPMPNAPQSPSTNAPPGYYDHAYDPHRQSLHLPGVQPTQGGPLPPLRPHSTEYQAEYPTSAYQPPPPPGGPGPYYQAPPTSQAYYVPPPAAATAPAPPVPAAPAYPQNNGDRSSSSPHTSAAPSVSYPAYNLHPPQSLPPQQPPSPAPAAGATSPRSGMSISNMLDGGKPGNPGRSATDSDMVNALNRKV